VEVDELVEDLFKIREMEKEREENEVIVKKLERMSSKEAKAFKRICKEKMRNTY